MLSVIYVVFGILIVALASGVVLSILVFVPLTLYVLPYSIWLGAQQQKGMYIEQDVKQNGLIRWVRNATKVYKHWITGKELLL